MLVDGDLKLTESSAILKYLADKIGSPTYPKELKQRAKVNEAMDWINSNFYRDWGYGLAYPQRLPHTNDAATKRMPPPSSGARRIRRIGSGCSTIIGSAPSRTCAAIRSPLPIISVPGIVTLGELIGCDFAPYPNIQRWISNMKRLLSWSGGNKGFYDLREMIKAQSFERI